jgi:hypothetical protein
MRTKPIRRKKYLFWGVFQSIVWEYGPVPGKLQMQEQRQRMERRGREGKARKGRRGEQATADTEILASPGMMMFEEMR